MATTVDLNLGSNLFGPLPGEVRARLNALIEDPNLETWTDAKSIILNRESWLTLWQAVLMLQHGRIPLTADPNDVPARETIVQAINYATH